MLYCPNRARRPALWIFTLALALALALGFVSGRFWSDGQASRRVSQLDIQFESTSKQNQADLNTAHAALDAAQAQLAIERSTRQGLEAALRQTQTELGQARDQLAFFEQLLPADPDGDISVRAFKVEQQGLTLRYRVLLTRNAPDRAPFDGFLQFTATGVQDGKAVQVRLGPAKAVGGSHDDGAGAKADALALGFDQFQRRSGLLGLPAGFVPESVTLNILRAGAVLVSRTVTLPRAD